MSLINRSVLVLILMGLFSCTGMRKSMKSADFYAVQGAHQKAYDEYYFVYRASGKAASFIGMKRTAEIIVQEKSKTLKEYFERADYRSFLLELPALKEMIDEFQREGISTSAVFKIADYEREAEERLADEYVAEVQSLLKLGDFDGARTSIRKLQGLNRNDRRIDGLWTLSEVLENYQLGEMAFEAGLLHQAYFAFDKVTQLDASFADALKIRNELKARLSYTLAYMSIPEKKSNADVEMALATRIQRSILALDNPFIQLVERDRLDAILEEQAQNMGAAFDEENAVEAGKLLGAKYLLTGHFASYELIMEEPLREVRKGFLGKSVLFAPRVIYGVNKVSWAQQAEFHWKLIDVESAQVFRTGTVPYLKRGTLEYGDFDGNYRELYPGKWTYRDVPGFNDKIYTNQRDLEELRNLFENGTQTAPSQEEFQGELLKLIAEKVAIEVDSFQAPYY